MAWPGAPSCVPGLPAGAAVRAAGRGVRWHGKKEGGGPPVPRRPRENRAHSSGGRPVNRSEECAAPEAAVHSPADGSPSSSADGPGGPSRAPSRAVQ